MSALANLTTYIAAESNSFLSAINESRGGLKRLLAEIDPVGAATLRYNQKVDQLEKALQRGKLTQDQYTAGVDVLKRKLEATTAVYAGHTASVGSSRAAQMELTHVVKASADQFAAGAPVTQIFAMHIAQLAQASTLAGESMGGFGKFMSTGWGLALTVAVVALAPLVGELFSAGDAADKTKDKTLSLSEALAQQTLGTKEARAAIQDYNEAQKKQREGDSLQTEININNTKSWLAKAQSIRDATRAELEKALHDEEAKQLQAEAGQSDALDAAALGDVRARIADLRTQIADIDARATEHAQNLRNLEIESAVSAAKAATDPLETINDHYNRMAAAAKRAAAANSLLAASIRPLLVEIEKERQAALKAEEARQAGLRRQKAENHQFGNDISSARAAEIVRGLGGRVNSGDRSHARQQQLYDQWVAAGRPSDNPVAAPGTSAHERGKALDVQMGPGISIATIREAFAAEGVRITKAIIERGHYHIEWGGAAPSAEQAAAKAEAERKRRLADLNSFQNEMAGLNSRNLQLQRGEAATIEARAALEKQRLIESSSAYAQDVENRRLAGRLTPLQARNLQLVEASNIYLQAKAVDRELLSAQAKRELEAGAAAASLESDVLRGQQELARTAEDRGRIEHRLLDIQYEQERKALEYVVAQAKLGKATIQEADAAQRRLDRLGELKANDSASIDERNMGTFAAYARTLNLSRKELGERAEQAVVDELRYVHDSIAQGIEDRLGIKDPWIKHLIEQFLDQAIMKPIANAIEEARAKNGGSSGGGVWGAISKALGIVSAGSGGTSGIKSGLGNFKAGLPHMDGGGSLRIFDGVDTNVLSINGIPRAMVSAAETISVNPANDRAANGNQGRVTNIYMDGVMTVEDFWGRIQALNEQHASGAVQLVEQRAIRRQQRRLGSGRR